MARIETVNGALKQWDTGRQVKISCDEGMTLQEVRFSNHHSHAPIRVHPKADGAADIPDELLRYSGALWVTAVVVDADGKERTCSDSHYVECAVRPDGYGANTGGGSGGSAGGGGGQIDIFVVKVFNEMDMDNGTLTLIPDKTFEETWAAGDVPLAENGIPVPNYRLILMHFMGRWLRHTGQEINNGKRAIFFADVFNAHGGDGIGGSESHSYHIAWTDSGNIQMYTVTLPVDYCSHSGTMPLNTPVQM